MSGSGRYGGSGPGDWPLDCKVYVGGLPNDATTEELEDQFMKYGKLRKVWVARNPPGFAFLEFEDARDAEDAVKAMDGAKICGVRARVEMSNGRQRGRGGGRGGGGGGGRYDDRDRGRGFGGRSEGRRRPPQILHQLAG